MRKTFPVHGVFGILFLFLSEIFLFKKVEPIYSWFYCLAWWSYIFAVDGVIFRLKGTSLIVSRRKEFFLMIPWSVCIWLIFEAANLSLENWYYINLPYSLIERWLGYAIAYGTILPGLFETTALLEAIGLFKTSRTRPTHLSRNTHIAFMFLGIFSIFSSVLMPPFFPLIWVGFIFLLEPLNYRFGGRSLLRDIEDGDPRRIYLLLIAGLICGLLWEFWNFWALSKWVYTVPFFETIKGFEMPFPGFLGFPPFAIQAYVMYNFISLFRFGRGWEESTYNLHPGQKTRRATSVLTAILMVSFYVLIFQAIDLKTVDSCYPRLEDAYWIEPRYRVELPKVGIASLEDLVQKTKDKTERDEWALRLLVSKEDFIPWIEKARLVLLKGLGIENLRLLEGAEISSVPALALENPETLHERLSQTSRGTKIPSLAKIRIWVREAQQMVRSSES
jgi:Domain of unknown function (DUF4332)